jgi:hypothetical protein
MLIRSKDKKKIVDALHVYVGNEVGSKRKYVFAGFAGKSFFHTNEESMGVYESEQEALDQINKMAVFFNGNPNGVYELE